VTEVDRTAENNEIGTGDIPAPLPVVSKSSGLESLDADLYAAVMAGDEAHVRARLGNPDRPLSEAEALLLIRTREREEEISEKIAVAEKLPEHKVTKEAPIAAELPAADEIEPVIIPAGTDEYGGRFEREEARYYDRHGGVYDLHGYQSADGSYRTAAGDVYDKATHTIRLAKGGAAEALPLELLGNGADLLRLAIRIREIRDEVHAEKRALRAAAEKQAAEAAAQNAARIVSGAAQAAGAPKAILPLAAEGASDEAYAAACCAREENEKARFEKMIMAGNFLAAAADHAAGALDHTSCGCLTHGDVHDAAHYMSANIAKGLAPHQLTRYQFNEILNTADALADKLAVALQQPVGTLPSLTDEANESFARLREESASIHRQLREDFTAFAKKDPEAASAVKAVIDMVLAKPRSLFRRPGMAMA
jgi:hypothetical protein